MKKIEAVKRLEYYLGLAYTTILKKDGDGDFVAKIQELPGCIAHGSDPTEAIDNLRAMQQAWIESCIESGQPVPEPEGEEPMPSGKWLQRVPRSLHQRLIKLAKHEGVSLNQLVTTILSDGSATKLFGDSVKHKAASVVGTSLALRILDERDSGWAYGGKSQQASWRDVDYGHVAGIVPTVRRIMPMVVPEDTKEHYYDAHQKETARIHRQ